VRHEGDILVPVVRRGEPIRVRVPFHVPYLIGHRAVTRDHVPEAVLAPLLEPQPPGLARLTPAQGKFRHPAADDLQRVTRVCRPDPDVAVALHDEAVGPRAVGGEDPLYADACYSAEHSVRIPVGSVVVLYSEEIADLVTLPGDGPGGGDP